MTEKSRTKPKPKKLTDADRHKRFTDMAQEVGASEDRKAFDKVFKAVAKSKRQH